MHSSNIVTVVVTVCVFAFALNTLAAPSTPRVGASAIPGPQSTPTTDEHAKPATSHHRHKAVSRRSPYHPDNVMARSNSGPLATATQLFNAASAMNGDRDILHQALTSLQSNHDLGRSAAFQKEISEKLAQWQKHANEIPTLTKIHQSLSYFGRDKGMANLDKSNEMEVTLKNTINSMKYSMSDLNLMVYQIPTLGPTLGPIVYQIKCILDDILNGTENTTDGLLNKLGLGKHLDLCSLMSNMSEFC